MSPEPSAELPPFSFSKKPIAAVPGSTTSMLTHTLPDRAAAAKPSLNNINYDEQIRAPRMSLASHYTYREPAPSRVLFGSALEDGGRSVSGANASGESEGVCAGGNGGANVAVVGESANATGGDATGANAPGGNATGGNATATDVAGAYLPATPDIHVPARRDLAAPDPEPLVAEHARLIRALANLHANTTSAERGLQQVYGMKKPLCTPAVLRPNDLARLALALPDLAPLAHFPIEVPRVPDPAPDSAPGLPPDSAPLLPQEPTHRHWMPNRASNHCMLCFCSFSAFFPPLRRRHHCRFCGLLFCHDCLYALPEAAAEWGVALSTAGGDDRTARAMMDARARLVVPIWRHHATPAPWAQFKGCKLCKNCGASYHRLVRALNHRDGDHVAAPYVFVDNPYLETRVTVPETPAVRERRALLAVPSDWTWSSF